MAPVAGQRPGARAEAEADLSATEIGHRASSGAAFLIGKGGLQQVLGLASTVVIARVLVPDQLGLFAIASTISAFLWMLSGGQGLAGGLIRRPVAPDYEDLRTYVALQVAITAILAAIVGAIALPFGTLGQVTTLMVAAGPIAAFRGAGWVVLERQLLYRKLATAETFELCVYYGWTISTVALGWGVWGLATATVARAVVGTTAVLVLSPTGVVLPLFDRRRARALLGIGIRVQAVELVAAARDQIVILTTAAVGSLSVVAYWSLLVRVLQAPGMLLGTLVRVSFPAMSRLQASGEDPGRLMPRLLPATTILTGALLAPLAGGAPALVPLLFGDKWLPVADVLPLACLALVIHAPLSVAGQGYLWALGDAKAPLRGQIIDAVVIAAVGLPLVAPLGVLGLVIGLVAAATAHAAVLAHAVGRHAHIDVLKLVRVPILFWAVAAGTGWACAQMGGPLLVRAVVSCSVALLVYIGLLALTHRELLGELAGSHPWGRRFASRREGLPVPITTN